MSIDSESEILFKWTNLCRLCLSSDSHIDLFSSEVVSQDCLTKIRSCLNILIYYGDPMPTKLCQSCLLKLDEWCRFKKECIQAEANIKARLQPYKDIKFVKEYFDKCAKFESSEIVSSSSKSNSYLAQNSDEVNSSVSTQECLEENYNKGDFKKCITSSEPTKSYSVSSSKRLPKSGKFRSKAALNQENYLVKKEWTGDEFLEIVSVTGSASAVWDVQHLKQTEDASDYYNHSENGRSKSEFEYLNEKICPECGEEFATEEEFDVHTCCMFGGSAYADNEDEDGHFEDSISFGSENDESELYSMEEQQESGGPVRSFTKVRITPWKCIPCRLYFQSCAELRRHYSSVSCYGKRARALECEFCFRQFLTFNDLLEHQVVHMSIRLDLTEDDLICCNQCSLQFPDERRFKNHSLIHALKRKIPIKYTCSCCSQVFFQKDLYEKHLESHANMDNTNEMMEEPSTNVSTPACDSGLYEEPKKLSGGAIRCFRCGQTFASVKQLEHHETTKHKNPTPFFCRKCGLRFSARSFLLMHLRVHMSKTNEKESPSPSEHVCNLCDSKFLLESDLESHMKTHKGQKVQVVTPPPSEESGNGVDMYAKYKCSLCPRLYVRANSCVRHGQQSHKGQKVVPLRLKRSVFVGRRTTFPPGGKVKHRCPKCPKYFFSFNAFSIHAYRSHGLKVSNPPEEPSKNVEIEESQTESANPSASVKMETPEDLDVVEKSEQFEHLETPEKSEILEKPGSPKPDEIESKCPFCSKDIKPSYISLHIKKFHRGEVLVPSMIDKEMPANSLICRYCLKTCSTPHNRKLHESIHYPVKGMRNQCETCGQKFIENSHYEDHVRTCLSIRCGRCSKIFFKYINLIQHSCGRTKNCEIHKCTVCLSAFTSLDLLQIHIKNFHDRKHETSTPQPGTSRNEMRRLQREMWREEANKIICMVGEKFYCTFCDCEFLTVQESNEHRAMHPRGNWYAAQISDSLFQCTICDKFFESRRSSLLHINHHKRNLMPEQPKPIQLSFEPEVEIFTDVKLSETVKNKKYNCRYCGATFPDEEDLQEHLFQFHVNQV